MRVSIGHGSPFVYCLYSGGNPVVSFAQPPKVWSGDAGAPCLASLSGGHHYGLFGSSGSTWTVRDGSTS